MSQEQDVMLASFGFEPLHVRWVASYPVEPESDNVWGVTWSEGYVEDELDPNGWYLCHSYDGDVDGSINPLTLEDALTLACQRNVRPAEPAPTTNRST